MIGKSMLRRANFGCFSLLMVSVRSIVAFQSLLSKSSLLYHTWKSQYRAAPRLMSTACNLFFRKTDFDRSICRRRNLSDTTMRDLQSSNLTLPFELSFENHDTPDVLSVRYMIPSDIQKVMPMCMEEFGTGPSVSLLDFPLADLRKIPDWWDRLYFGPMITLSLLSKMSSNLSVSRDSRAKDPAVLVLCRHSLSGDKDEEIVGMVEVSLQAPEADRNPPPFPVPLIIKSFYGHLVGKRLQGWVTNMLIDPRCRGLGYSKILMAATEGITKSWGCSYIYLHADADFRSGKVAQGLYKSLGYEVVMDKDTQYAWMKGSSGSPFSSIRIIEGVPLLCFRKRIVP